MILIAGGSGRLGSQLAARLVANGEQVRILTRDRSSAAPMADLPVEVCIGDVRDPGTLVPAVQGVDVVVSAVHGFAGPGRVSPSSVDRDGNANLIDAAAAAGAEFVLMSVVGAAADSPLELFRMKYAAERRLHESSVSWTIVRATAFMDLWLDLLRKTAGRSGRPVVFGRGDNPINFVAVHDVAAVVVDVIGDPATRGQIIEVGGPHDLTFNQLAAAAQRASGRTGATRHVPRLMLTLMANTVGRVKPDLGRQVRAALVMDSADFTWHPDRVQGALARAGTTTVAEVLDA